MGGRAGVGDAGEASRSAIGRGIGFGGAGSGRPDSRARAEAAVASLKSRSMSHEAVDEITKLAVAWVHLNPVLVELDLPDVGR